jgi:hypothetical protein
MVACGACFSVILTEDGAVRTCGQFTSSCLGVTVAVVDVELNLPNVCCDFLEPALIDVCKPGLTHPAAFSRVNCSQSGLAARKSSARLCDLLLAMNITRWCSRRIARCGRLAIQSKDVSV